jgi:hypothetical protein
MPDILECKEEFLKTHTYSDRITTSDYIIRYLLPNRPEYAKSWIFVVTQYGTYKVQLRKLDSYTDYDNDCLAIYINKSVHLYINVSDVTAIEPEERSIANEMPWIY